MADDVPVSDVLCEAMEYLSKLGSNLRARSDILKEKRIRSDKLKNAHAVQKAANKVLLICELSRKSLENVETGVKKILNLVDASQKQSDSDGGKSSTRRTRDADKKPSSDKKREVHYIHYQSKNLRISKKISMKHYTSVKVLAKKMSMSFIEMYPVYHDCKLYRLRRKQVRKDSDQSSVSSSCEIVNEKEKSRLDKETNQSPDSKRLKPNEEVEDYKDAILSESLNNRCEKEKINPKNDSESDSDQSKISECRRESKHSRSHKDKNDSSDGKEMNENKRSCDTNNENGSCKEQKASKHGKTDSKNESRISKESRERLRKSRKKEKGKERHKSSKEQDSSSDESTVHKSRERHRSMKYSGDSSDNNEKTKLKTSPMKKNISVINSDDSSDNNEKTKLKTSPMKKNISVINLSSDDEESTAVATSTKKEQSYLDESKDINDKKAQQKSASDNEINESNSHKADSSNDESNEKKTDNKPLIKCVSLTKLLKPTVLEKVADRTIKAIRSKERDQEMLKKKLEREEKKKLEKEEIIKLQKEEDEHYWTLKREEVKSFKAKEFKINVVKLPPKFTAEFLNKHSLRRITQKNSILFELEEKELLEKDNGIIKDSDPPIDEIKISLLNDSDSESSPVNNIVFESQNAKNTLLDDSDPDNNGAGDNECISETNDNVETLSVKPSEYAEEEQDNSGLQSGVHEKTPEKELPKATAIDADLAKSSLLESSNPTTPGTLDKKCRKSESVTPSKRKHVMESMNAKKMLLTHSSSSSEDEKIKTKIQHVHKELLKGSSDEETTPKVSRKKTISSDSDEDIELLKRAKKKRKTSNSKHSSSDKEKSGSDSDKNDSHKTESNDEKGNGSDQEGKSVPAPDTQEKVQDGKAAYGDSTADLDADDKQSDSSSSKMGRSKQKKGSSSNSDGQEDKEIDSLADLKSLSRTRTRPRRGSPKSDGSTSKSNRAKAKAVFEGEGLLEANLTSEDDGSDSIAVEEDLPPVSLSALNGSGGIEHLAKNDLLGSETDGSNDESDHEPDGSDNGPQNDKDSDDDKKDDSDNSDTIKARRRKGNTISSDSEAGSSRRKAEKTSDFEDSDDSEPKKAKKKKRKKGSDSDSAGSSSDGKKKRRRIKSVNDSDASGSDSDNDGRNKHGRKNIRKVMGKNQLEAATKRAAREERERMARIVERQKMYNNVQFDESGKPDEVILDKVVLDYDPETKEPLIEVDRGLVKKLKPHQANGIKFMWDACFESVKRIKKDRGSGCILAHCMGLGKTLQVVSLTHTLLTHQKLTGVHRVLVVCPLSTVLNWVNEFRMWLEFADNEPDVDVYELSRYKQNSERAYQLSQWFKHGGICVLGYEMFRNLSADNVKKFKKKMLKTFQESLVDPGPDMVVCDEGHLLKNEKTSLSQSMNRVKTRRRIVLTGTPLQNNLKEYYCMVQFVKPNLLGKYNEYLNRFVNPITNGQYTDSTEHDIKIMKRRSHVLHTMLDGAVQRRDYGVLAPFLPPKHEYVLFITLTPIQTKLYQHYLDNYSRRPLAGKSSGFLFPDFQSLQRIWTHPLVLKYNSERYEIMQQKKRDKEEEEDSEGSLVDFIDDDSTPDETSSDDASDDMSDLSDDSRKKSKKKKAAKKNKAKEARANNKRTTRANPELDGDDEPLPELPQEVKHDNPTEWWMPLVSDDELEDLRHSNKLVLLFEILRQCECIGDKLLVFSQSLYSLDLIEHFLGKVDEATQEGRIDEKLGGHVGSWSPGIDYFRLDGSSSCENRSIWCKNFNREDNPRARLFLISTRAGGLGINLVAANRVIIFDVSWNPSHDVQSIFRVYRFGQKKPCYVYRFLAMGTMEEKIYERQVTKQAISKRVIDEQQIDRHYAENDLAELYKFEPTPPSPRPVPLVPKDRFFAEMLKEHEALIYKFHEHDSLLENKTEETLSEEERKAAWDDFENEKNRPPPAPFPSWPMQNGMMPNLLAQQQQQMAFAALGAVLRKDMPGLSEEQIRGMIPLIYGSNPGLMQKLNDMYKYTQPMMNPAAMMNPAVMAAGGASMGGSSGLQYEPPWQRQQQQQQQMRLQQLMQAQSQAGQKFYSGGLGSRDPVAMALQQQRAREIMLGERGRPRGRPPARQPAAGDVVNLDSD